MKLGKLDFKRAIAQLYIRYRDDDICALSAQTTFYILMSLFPFLLFLLNMLSFTPVSVPEFISNIKKFMPDDVAAFFSNAVLEIVAAKSPALLSLSAFVTLISASVGISAISRGLNKAYDIEETRPFLKIRGASLIFTIGIAVMVLTTLLFLIFGDLIGEYIFRHFADTEALLRLWSYLRYAVPVGMMILLFTLLYICVPARRIRFSEALPGSLFSTAGWIIVSVIFSVYVNNFASYAKIYGSIGGIIVLLIWLYLSCMILLIGGEINATLSYIKAGSKIAKYEKPIELPFRKKTKLK